jgi:hypothetical protein
MTKNLRSSLRGLFSGNIVAVIIALCFLALTSDVAFAGKFDRLLEALGRKPPHQPKTPVHPPHQLQNNIENSIPFGPIIQSGSGTYRRYHGTCARAALIEKDSQLTIEVLAPTPVFLFPSEISEVSFTLDEGTHSVTILDTSQKMNKDCYVHIRAVDGETSKKREGYANIEKLLIYVKVLEANPN